MRYLAAWLVLLVGCGGKPPPPPPPPPRAPQVVAGPPEPAPEQKAAAEAIASMYKVLTTDSAVPGDAEVLRDAAIEALAPKGWKAAPLAWKNDVSKDAAVLRGAVQTLALRGELADGAVLRAATAMAAAVKDTHTFALATSGVPALFALVEGRPVVQVGLLLHKVEDGRWAVTEVLPGSAADNARVQRGDILVSIAGEPVVRGYLDLAPFMGVPEGSELSVVVERAGKNEDHNLRLMPVAAPIAEWRVLAGSVGYLRLWSCPRSDDPKRDAGKVVGEALAALDKKKIKKLVLDLRGNPGGYPFDVASLLVTADPLMLGINTEGAQTPVARTVKAVWQQPKPLAVLVDEGTASGAEMLALALRDHAGATLVGKPTAGGLTFPTLEKQKHAPEVSLSYPLSRVGSPRTQQPLDGNHLEPDVAAANPTEADYAAHKDPQLDAALATLKALK